MDVSYIELRRLAEELLELVRDSKIENLYLMEDGSIVLKIRGENVSGELRIAPGKCLYFTRGSYEKPLSPGARGLALRRIVSGTWIRDIRVVPGERIVFFDLEVSGKRFSLVAELIPKGTVIVLDQGGKILESLHHLRMRDRAILPGEVYRLPPPKPSAAENPENLFTILSPRKSVVAALASQAGLGGRYAEEIVKLAGVNGLKKVKELEEDEKERLIKALKRVLELTSSGKPVVAFSPEGGVQALPYPLESLREKGWRFRETDTLNEAFKEAYEHELAEKIQEAERRKIEEKAEKIEDEARRKIYTAEKLRGRVEKLRAIAEKLFKYASIIEELKESRENLSREFEGLEIEIKPSEKTLIAKLDGEEVKLKIHESIMKQVSALYDDAKKALNAAQSLMKDAEKLRKHAERIRRGEAKLVEEAYLRVSAHPPRPGKGEWYERYRWFITSEGFLAVAGKDASSNTSLLKKHLERDDLVFHAEVRGAPVLLLKNGVKAGERSRIEAAQFAASYSRAWREKMSMMTVYYVRPEQVSFTPPPGHYLPKGGFIVKGERNYLTVKLELGFGIGEGLELIHGPPTAVSSKAGKIVKIVPGRRKAEEIAEEVVRRLTEGMELEPKLLRDLRRWVAELVPYGSGEVV